MQLLLSKAATVVQPLRTLKMTSLLIEGGKIAAVGDNNISRADREIDCASLTIFPGFIDAHIHGCVGVDVMNATPESLSEMSSFLSTKGVTSWLPTLVPGADDEYQWAVDAISQAMEHSDRGARVVGLHYEGPFVNSNQCGALHREHFKTYSKPHDLEELPIPGGAAATKMITVAPEIVGGIELVKELQRRGWVISIGHTRADETVLDQAANAGAHHMTHFMNAMPQLHHRQPGPVGWGLSRDDVTCDMIADGIHLHPLTLRAVMKAKGSSGVSLISDAIAAAGKGDGDYQIWGETISVRNGRTSNVNGNIAGSVISMLDAVRMMRSVGASEVDVALMAATNPARLLRLDQECGSIEVGKRADLVALDEAGNVHLTIVGGEVVFEKKEN